MKVPIVSNPDLDRYIYDHGEHGVLRVTSLEVGHQSSSPVLYVKTTYRSEEGHSDVTLVLSPPAAARLSHELQRHLDLYLHGKEDQD